MSQPPLGAKRHALVTLPPAFQSKKHLTFAVQVPREERR